MATEHALYTILKEKIRLGTLVLPTLPKIALKVRSAADDPEINLNVMSDIISQDPALSVGVIRVANSAILGRSVKVESVNQAVTRIGLRQIKSIATAIAMEQVFKSDNDIVAQYLKKSWNKTVKVAAVAIALMTHYRQCFKRNNSLCLDSLTLAALVHNIGVLPILTEAERNPDVFANHTFLTQAIAKLSSPIGSLVVDAWGFSQEFVDIAEKWSDLTVLPSEVHYLDFIRAGAIYHQVFKNESTREVLLNSYVKKRVLPSDDFMASAEFDELYQAALSMFK